MTKTAELNSSMMFDRQQFGSSRRRIIFFIGGYKTTVAMYRPLYAVMRLMGYRVYAYSLDPTTVVSSNILSYVGQITAIQKDIAATLKTLPEGVPAYTMGNSLGSESALYALKHTPQLLAAALITARGSIAEFIWHTSAGKTFKPVYQNNNYDFSRLSQELDVAEPTKDLKLIGQRPVYVYYSEADNVIPASNTELLIKKLDEAHVSYHLHHARHGGHLASTIAGLITFWRWNRFFRQS